VSRLRKLLAAWLAPPDMEPAEPACDPEPPQERELVRRTPATPGRELAVAMLLAAAAVLFAAFVVAYALGASTQVFGVTLGGGLALVAAALITAGRTVVLQVVMDEPRPATGEGDSAEAAAGTLREGGEGMSRRRLLGIAGGAAAVTLGSAAVVPVFSAAEGKGGATGSSPWRSGTPLVDEQGRPVRADQLEIGSFLTAFPEGADPRELGSPVVVCAVDPAQLHPAEDRRGWDVQGIQAFSKICTHAGCAVSLFRYPTFDETQPGPALVCPCHYSTFNPADGGKVLFGPAGRPLPQLPLRLGTDGSLEAAGGFYEPIGPSYGGIREAPGEQPL
jgi:ubiquinol-cytochrome c reductase iron-sulfur subunit